MLFFNKQKTTENFLNREVKYKEERQWNSSLFFSKLGWIKEKEKQERIS